MNAIDNRQTINETCKNKASRYLAKKLIELIIPHNEKLMA